MLSRIISRIRASVREILIEEWERFKFRLWLKSRAVRYML
jgi:hypothetical protein